MPVVILINFFVCFALSLSAWLWMPVPLIIFQIFELIFYDNDSHQIKEKGISIRVFKLFPLLLVIQDLTVLGVF